jgi:hypothetical protein
MERKSRFSARVGRALCLLGAAFSFGCAQEASSSDTDTGDAGAETCTFVIDDDGGVIEACGLRIWAPPGSVEEATTIRVTHPAVDAAPPAGLARESQVFRLEADGEEFALLAYATIHLPQQSGGSAVWVAKEFPEYGSFGVLETCFKAPGWGGVRTSTLGTFTVLTDVAGNDQPSSGQADVTWGSLSGAFDFEGVGFAHYVPLPSGERSVDLYGVRLQNESYETFRLSFGMPGTGLSGGALVSLMAADDQGGFRSWINYDGITPPSEIALDAAEPEADHLVGTMSGTLFAAHDTDNGWDEMEVAASFDAHAARYFVPTDDPCEIP